MKKILFIFVIIVSLFVINNLFTSIYDLWKKQDLLTQANQQLKTEEEKNQKLKAQLQYVSSESFIEEEARNKLFLVKPNEQVLVIQDLNQATESARIVDVQPDWMQWMNLFFK